MMGYVILLKRHATWLMTLILFHNKVLGIGEAQGYRPIVTIFLDGCHLPDVVVGANATERHVPTIEVKFGASLRIKYIPHNYDKGTGGFR